jgi:hypothetical protein
MFGMKNTTCLPLSPKRIQAASLYTARLINPAQAQSVIGMAISIF